MSGSALPWERLDGTPAGTGIGLSGGGLRAAAFSFGVLQELQEELGLVYGPKCAQFVSVVSGGSYIAASYLLGARQQRVAPLEYADRPPLSAGSPEEEHIITHGRYLRARIPPFALFVVLNFLAFAMLFIWFGFLLADYALIRDELAGDWPLVNRILGAVDGTSFWLLAITLVLSIGVLTRCLYAEDVWRRRLLPIPFLVVVLVLCQPVIRGAASRPEWWTRWAAVQIVMSFVVLLSILAVAVYFARKIGLKGRRARVLNTIASLSPRLLGIYLFAFAAVHWYQYLSLVWVTTTPTLYMAGALVGTLMGGFICSYVPDRASLHREYRKGLKLAFGVHRRDGQAFLAGDVPLSSCGRLEDTQVPFPRLLVCATANVHGRTPERGRFSFVPFVLSYDACGVPGRAGISFPTTKLELEQVPATFLGFRKESVVSLFTAVATTGAAAAPSMGRYTLPSVRPFIAALNIRLGRWLLNPFSARVQRAVAQRTLPGSYERHQRLGPGYNELVPEMLGLDGSRIYVSDGGHYDNLGLLALMRAKCADIWCVDASPEPKGQCEELLRILQVAKDELGVNHTIDLTPFKADAAGWYSQTHVLGRLEYSDGSHARLVIVKLGLSPESPTQLKQVRDSDRGFPHHKTFRQFYRPNRMRAYIELGRDSASRCLADPSARG